MIQPHLKMTRPKQTMPMPMPKKKRKFVLVPEEDIESYGDGRYEEYHHPSHVREYPRDYANDYSPFRDYDRFDKPTQSYPSFKTCLLLTLTIALGYWCLYPETKIMGRGAREVVYGPAIDWVQEMKGVVARGVDGYLNGKMHVDKDISVDDKDIVLQEEHPVTTAEDAVEDHGDNEDIVLVVPLPNTQVTLATTPNTLAPGTAPISNQPFTPAL